MDTIIKLDKQKAARSGNMGDAIIANAEIWAAVKNSSEPNQPV